jgi:predicted RNase H-like nuclease
MNLDLPKMRVVGVDGCHGGWLCIELIDNTLSGHVFKSFSELLDGLASASIIAIDIPLGLPDAGERPCDKIVRKFLGPPRASSVFPAPIHAVISGSDYQMACEKHRQIDGRALSRQAFAILPKIFEVDTILAAKSILQERVREVHPEVCFAIWNGGKPMQHNKTMQLGRAERERLIDTEWPGHRFKIASEMSGSDFKRDDLNDAFAALWTAKRIVFGIAQVFGPQTKDHCGLRMEMWA